jgi:hypothetical protein
MKKTTLEKQESAIQLRHSGKSVKEIAKELRISVGTTHLLVRGIVLSDEVQKQIRQRGMNRSSERVREQTRIRKTQLGLKSQTATVGSEYDPKGIGDKSTAQILAAFLIADMKVLTPFGDRFRYDLVVDEGGKFIRVQCKTAKFKGDSFEFSCNSNNWNSGKVMSYKGQCEVFAVYLREMNKVYVFNVGNCPDTGCTVRLLECRQKKNTRSATKHEFQIGKSLLDYP